MLPSLLLVPLFGIASFLSPATADDRCGKAIPLSALDNGSSDAVESNIILSGYPSSGPTIGNTTVVVKVQQPLDLDLSYSCSFGDNSNVVAGITLNSTHLQCSSPARSAVGKVELRILDNDQNGDITVGRSRTWFTYYQQPVVDEISPKACTELSPTTVTLRGSGFRAFHSLVCRFGDVIVPGRLLSALRIQCASAPLRPGRVIVEVSPNGGVDFTSSGIVLDVYTRFTILSKSPEEGPMRGGAKMIILGTGFKEELGMSCYFGSSSEFRGVKSEYISPNELSCAIPPSTFLGPVPFELCWGQKVNCVAGGSYNYRDDLHLLGASPLSGPDSGGTVVWINMNGPVSSEMQCSFGSVRAPFEAVNGTIGYCMSPARPVVSDDGHQSIVELTVSGSNYDMAVGSFFFTYVPPVVLTDVVPQNIPEVAAGFVRVVGNDLPNIEGLACLVGDTSLLAAMWMSRTLILCNVTAMPGLFPAVYPLAIVYGDQSLLSRSMSTLDVEIDPAISVSRIVPQHGPPGTVVAVYGTNLASSKMMWCRFGSRISPAQDAFNASFIKCIAPFYRRYDKEPVPLAVSSNGIHFPAEPQAVFTYTADANIISLDPDVVDTSRTNVAVSINGTDLEVFLESVPRCHLRDTELSANAVITSSTVAKCEFPALPVPGTYFLELSSMYQANFHASNHLRVVPSPVVMAVEPSWALTSATGRSSDRILVRGTNFTSWKLSCIIGSDIVPAIWLSSSTALCTLPFLRRGNYAVRMSNDGSTPSFSSVSLIVFEPIQIHSLSPLRGDVGSLITVRGRDFVPAMACQFGDERSIVPSHFLNSTHLQCRAPHMPNAPGLTMIGIVLDEVSVVAEPRIYFDYVDLVVTSLHPSSGSVKGGTEVAVMLRHDQVDVVSHCRFGASIVDAIVTPKAGNVIKCKSPPALPEVYLAPLALSTNAIDFTVSYLNFVYLSDPFVDRMEPLSGPDVGGTELLLFGSMFANSVALGCRLVAVGSLGKAQTNVTADGQWYSAESISCATPPLYPWNYSVEVTLNGVDFIETGFHFVAEPTVTVSNVSPTFGRSSGGTVVTIYGSNFVHGSDLVCRFDDDTVPATFKSTNEVECSTPTRAGPVESVVSVSNNGRDFVSWSETFRFYNDLVMDSFVPQSGTTRGGTTIEIRGGSFSDSLDSMYCLFGDDVLMIEAIVESDSVLACLSPQAPAPANKTLSVAYGSDLYPVPDAGFSFEDDIMITTLSPPSIPSNVGGSILVSGDTFRKSSLLCCRLGSNDTFSAMYVDRSHVYCRIPLGLKTGSYPLTVANNCQDFSPDPTHLHVLNPIQPFSLFPAVGLCAGSTTLTVSGTNFIDIERLSCRFGERFFVPARLVNATHIECVTPRHQVPGLVPVEVMVGNNPVTADSRLYFEYLDVTVKTFVPSSGSVKGGTAVTIKLLQDDVDVVTHCRFGDSIVEALAGNGGDVTCISPPSSQLLQNGTEPKPFPFLVPLDVGVNGVDFTTSHRHFTYLADPVVESTDPQVGPDIGGTELSLHGRSFSNRISLGCRFVAVGRSLGSTKGPVVREGQWISSESMSCMTPRLFPGTYSVEITMNGVDYISSGRLFTSFPQITIESFEPPSGPAAGGTDVIVYGGPFKSSLVLGCKFGSATSIIPAFYHNSSKISCRSPALTDASDLSSSSSEGVASLQVTANEIDYSNALPFYYHVAPILLELMPRHGVANGATTVIVHGANFVLSLSGSARCKFGTSSVKAIVLSSTKIRCDAPPLPQGEVDVRISFNNGHDWSHPHQQRFEYKDVGTISSIYPSGGSSSGGTLVMIRGSNFMMAPSLCCNFGSIKTKHAVWISANEVHCKAPSHHPGVVALSVLNDCGDDRSLTMSAAFEYYHLPIVSSLIPSSGHRRGGTIIRIVGRYLRSSEDIFCRFNTVRVDAVVSPDGYVECLSPPKARLQVDKANVSVGDDSSGIFHAESELWFSYAEPPFLQELAPPFGSPNGNEEIMITGTNLDSTGKFWCRFSGCSGSSTNRRIVVPGESVTNTSTICRSPPQSRLVGCDMNSIHVDVSTNNADWSSQRLLFRYMTTPVVAALHPRIGMQGGGTRLTVSGSSFEQVRRYDVSFGSVGTVHAEWRSNTTLFCDSPRSSFSGKTEIVLIVDDTVNVPTDHAFEYLMPISVFDLHPTRGPLEGGTMITVQGTNFVSTETLSCRFGAASVVEAHFISSNEISCASPIGILGKTRVEVSLDGQAYYQSNNITTGMFTYEHLPSIRRTIPANAPVGKAVNVTLIGNHFVHSPSFFCRFGTAVIPAVYRSTNRALCMVPASDVKGQVNVGLTTNTADFSLERVAFRFLDEVRVYDVSPSIVQEGVETALFVRGANFLDSQGLFCHFGEKYNLIIAQWVSPTTLRCRTPALKLKWSQHGVDLSVTNNGGNSISADSVHLQLSTRAHVLSMSPSFGYAMGGAVVTVRSAHFHHQPNATVCLWSEARIPARIGDSRYEIQCISPPHVVGDLPLSIASHGIAPVYAGHFSYVAEPQISMLNPSHGSVEGGTQMVITGDHLTNITSCIFIIESSRNETADDRRVIVDAEILSKTEIACKTPKMARQTSGLVQVTTTAGGGYTSRERLYFVFRDPPRLLSAYPPIGPDIGGASVSVEGSGFLDTPSLKCRFGLRSDSVVQARFISDRRILCNTPTLPTGEAPIFVTTNGVDFTPEPVPYRFHGPVEIHSIAPSVGTVRGGTRVVIHASNIEWTEKLACNFAIFHVDATYINTNTLSCVSPVVLEAGEVNISITLNGRDYASGPNRTSMFRYVPAPEVLSIIPDQGWMNGGTHVCLETRNVYNDPSSKVYCAFGPRYLVEAKRVDDTFISCTSPKYDENISVTDNSSVSVSLVYENTEPKSWGGGPSFTFANGAVISSVTPSVGSVSGGSLCVVSGINFRNRHDLQCVFGKFSVPARFINEGEVSCSSPAQRLAPGSAVTVKVESISGSIRTMETFAQFEYTTHPSLYSVYPALGKFTGGTRVNVTGHFSESHAHLLSCRFGNSPPILGEYVSPQQMWCLSPSLANTASSNATVDVAISNNGLDWVYSRDDDVIFTYYIPPLRIMDIQPRFGPVTGGTSVRVSFADGAVLSGMENIACHFGTASSVPALIVTSVEVAVTVVECIAPRRTEFQKGSVHLEISVNGGNDMTTSQQSYSYYRDPIIERIGPSYGYAAGGESIRVHGQGFVKSADLTCRFDTHVSPQARWISSSEVECTSPRIDPAFDARVVSVEVATNGVDYGKTNEDVAWPEFSFINNPAVVHVVPSIASADGGTLCSIEGKNLDRAVACRFGTLGIAVPVIKKTSSEILCRPPPIPSNSPYLQEKAEIFIDFEEIGFRSVGLELTYEPHRSPDALYALSLNDTQAIPVVALVEPGLVGGMGGYNLRVLGGSFVNRQGLACLFGPDIVVPARYISSQEIQCPSPRLPPGVIMVDVINGGSLLKSKKGYPVSFFADFGITTSEPDFGPVGGGTIVSIYGPFPPICVSENTLKCRFGNIDVYAYRIDNDEVGCIAPPVWYPETVKVQVSCNDGESFSESYQMFSYENSVQIDAISPSHGGLLGGTEVVVEGRHFKNTSALRCLFGNSEYVRAEFMSENQILCKSPPRIGPGKVNVEVSTNGLDYSSSLQKYEYRRPPVIKSIWPNAGNSELGGTKVFVKGSLFSDEIHLACSFDGTLVQATYIDNTTLSCASTPHSPGIFGFKVVGDMYSGDLSYQSAEPLEFLFYQSPSVVAVHPPRGSALGGIPVFVTGSNFFNTSALRCRFGTMEVRANFISGNSIMCVVPPSDDNSRVVEVAVTVSVNGKDYSPENGVNFVYHRDSMAGHYSGPSGIEWSTPAPSGTYANAGDVNFTLCEPGRFQPKPGQSNCLDAPVGYYAPDFGLSKPVICDAGMVCDRTGLAAPSSPCPRGHYCKEGTKTRVYNSLFAEAEDLSLLKSVYFLWKLGRTSIGTPPMQLAGTGMRT